MIVHGDCLIELAKLADNSVDSVVCDPPYGLKFMGKKWDYDVPSVEVWREVLRVLKPGGHLLSFGGTRTYHRMVVAIEDAGFEIRDQIQWIYGSGFPKSLDVSKAIDKLHGAEREVVSSHTKAGDIKSGRMHASSNEVGVVTEILHTVPSTTEAKQWQGWGTALKPANEPIVLARKPLEGTVAQNVLKHGVGGLNIDASRIGAPDLAALQKNWDRVQSKSAEEGRNAMSGGLKQIDLSDRAPSGRWPANIILDEAAAEMLDEQSVAGGIHSAGKARPRQEHTGDFGIGEHGERKRLADHRFADNKIGASRFFYCAKASKSERNHGCEGMAEILRTDADGLKMSDPRMAKPQKRVGNQNHHPCVKPIKLMEYLITLICPPGGIVLDPFMGSGSTCVAASKLGYQFIGIEIDKDYIEIAQRRIEAVV